MKLVDVVRGLSPEVAAQISAAGQDLVVAMNHGTAAASQGDDSHAKMQEALQTYGRTLAAQFGKEWDPALLVSETLAPDRPHAWATVEEQRPPFEALTCRMQDVILTAS